MASQRPKRRIIPKKLDDDGMHWREEQDILKAMYASLRGNQMATSASEEEEEMEKVKPKRKKQRLSKSWKKVPTTKSYSNSKVETTNSCNLIPVSNSPKNSTITTTTTSSSTSNTLVKTKRLNAAPVPYAKRRARQTESRYPRRIAKIKPSLKVDVQRACRSRRKPAVAEGMSVKQSKEKLSEPKVRAQRKFAQSLPPTPSTTPVKLFTCDQPELVRACPKTEDFLTFLCLKGSPALPHALAFFQCSDNKRANEEVDEVETKLQVNDSDFSIPGIEPISDNLETPTSNGLAKDTSAIPNTAINPPCLDPGPPPIPVVPRKRAPPRLLPMIPFIPKGHTNGLRKPRKEQVLKGIPNNHLLKTKERRKNGLKSIKHRKPFLNNNNHQKILDKDNSDCIYLRGDKLHNGALKRMETNCTLELVSMAFKPARNGRVSKRRHKLAKCQTKGMNHNNNSLANNVNDKLLQAAALTLPKNGLIRLFKPRTKADTKKDLNSVVGKVPKNHVNHVISTLTDQTQVKVKRKRGRPKQNPDLNVLKTRNASKVGEADRIQIDNKLPQGTQTPTGHISLAKKRRTSSKYQTDFSNCSKTPVTATTNRSPKRTRNSLPIHAKVVATDAPVLYPNQGSWSDPIAYVTAMSDDLEKCGICKVVPPKGWRPECKLKDDMKFNTEVQYINRLYHIWNLESRQLACIKRHLKEQGNGMVQPPQVGGCEVDLVKLSQILSEQEGMKSENVRWNKIADTLRIPKTIQGRVNKLYKIYCEYLVSYHMLTSDEKQKLDHALEKERTKSHKLGIFNSVEEENCIKGRCISLLQFCKSAHNTQQMYFKREPAPAEVEKEYWQAVHEGSQHISVKKAVLATTTSGRHSWNLTNISTNQLNLLHCLGNKHPINIPVMKINMLFSTETWHCNQHALATIDYLHTGAPKIWYCVPASHFEQANAVLKQEFPQQSANILHPLNNANFKCMVPMSAFLKAGIPVYRLVQEAGQFVVTWPGMTIATVSCGYNVAEVVNFATASWLGRGQAAFKIFQDLKETCQFSFEHLLTLLASKPTLHGNTYLMDQVLALLKDIRDRELILRQKLADRGMKTSIRFVDPASPARIRDKRSKPISETGEEHVCWICKCSCFLSMVVQEKEGRVFCLHHGLEAAQKTKVCRTLKLMYRYSEDELHNMITDLEDSMKQAYGKNSSPKRRKKKEDKTL